MNDSESGSTRPQLMLGRVFFVLDMEGIIKIPDIRQKEMLGGMQLGSVSFYYFVGYDYARRFRLDHVRIDQLDQIDGYCGAGSGATITKFRTI
ncbi:MULTISPECIES: hypothetical protein [unclassified Paenibacillus]|uniref:hypothetical protein n=1 Tax=unclassified Paenibacillus TaxID=185978 RepID=UPI0009568D43|nr:MULTISPECIES: hypothetical protein [unclassified Paenibacillus]ASS68808.1 hypothetical protein CIC07_23690 [Paenibacillus sp. RUD330]SIR58102.1 hypothetical protein SAMN05880555_4339 [Paenibacillus sp. RU4X]SIR66844.1 hypothetical protein SAMN05880570_4341 [Paenibacillus sp. RU4T]